MSNWRVGVEIELMTPPATDRRQLAEACAKEIGGRVEPFFHIQSEKSAVPGVSLFENLMPGFRLFDASGSHVADFVDDLTLQADFDRSAPPYRDWYRILADDKRLINLALAQCRPGASLREVLEPVAAVFSTSVQHLDEAVYRVDDRDGTSVAMATSLPGERQRACEIVTAPLEANREASLRALCGRASAFGCTLPQEAAVHIHFDAAPIASTRTLARIIQLFSTHREELRDLVGVNPNCVRLGPWNEEVIALASEPVFMEMPFDEACETLGQCDLTKYCDFNLLNLVRGSEDKNTFEVRILPGTLDAERILAWITMFERLLLWCREDGPIDDAREIKFAWLLEEAGVDDDLLAAVAAN